MARLFVCLMLGLICGCTAQDAGETNGLPASAEDTGGVLVAASNMRHPPFSSWNAAGEADGIEVDLVEEAARELGFRVTWVERPFAELLTAVETGEIDIAASTIGITEEREKRVAFSDPYYETQIVALVRNDPSSPGSLADLARSTIGADEATTSYTAAKQQWPSATLVGRVRDGMTWPRMVDRKLIDAFVVDASDQERLESESGISLRRIEQPLRAEYFGIALARGENELRAALNRAIGKLERGRLREP